jgi:hypothetical protein
MSLAFVQVQKQGQMKVAFVKLAINPIENKFPRQIVKVKSN